MAWSVGASGYPREFPTDAHTPCLSENEAVCIETRDVPRWFHTHGQPRKCWCVSGVETSGRPQEFLTPAPTR